MLVMWMKRNITLGWLNTHVVLNLTTFEKIGNCCLNLSALYETSKFLGSLARPMVAEIDGRSSSGVKPVTQLNLTWENLPGLDIVGIDILINPFVHFIALFWSSFPLIIFGGLEKVIFCLLESIALSHCHTHTHFPTEICSVCLSSSLSRMRTSNFCYTAIFIISDSLIIFIVFDEIDVRLGALLRKNILCWLLMMSWTTK